MAVDQLGHHVDGLLDKSRLHPCGLSRSFSEKLNRTQMDLL